jgi:hypothetical protein
MESVDPLEPLFLQYLAAQGFDETLSCFTRELAARAPAPAPGNGKDRETTPGRKPRKAKPAGGPVGAAAAVGSGEIMPPVSNAEARLDKLLGDLGPPPRISSGCGWCAAGRQTRDPAHRPTQAPSSHRKLLPHSQPRKAAR